MEDQQQEIRQELEHYLRLGSRPELADSLDRIPDKYQEALYNMISEMQYNRAQPTIIAFHVTEDVIAVTGGAEVTFCKGYLNTD